MISNISLSYIWLADIGPFLSPITGDAPAKNTLFFHNGKISSLVSSNIHSNPFYSIVTYLDKC